VTVLVLEQYNTKATSMERKQKKTAVLLFIFKEQTMVRERVLLCTNLAIYYIMILAG
jgi:hypothetical protein